MNRTEQIRHDALLEAAEQFACASFDVKDIASIRLGYEGVMGRGGRYSFWGSAVTFNDGRVFRLCMNGSKV